MASKQVIAGGLFLLVFFAIFLIITNLGPITHYTPKDMAKIVPYSENFTYIAYFDLQQLRNDEDLKDIYGEVKSTLIKLNYESLLGVDVDSINYLVAYLPGKGEESYGKDIRILIGKLNLENIRTSLREHHFKKEEYKGVEVWRGLMLVAVSNNVLIAAENYDTLKNCIRVIKGEENSLYDNEEVREIIDKLPNGIVMIIEQQPEYWEYKDLLYVGNVVIKEDERTVKGVGVAKFANRKSAKDAKTSIEHEIEKDERFFDVHVNQSGKLLWMTAKMNMEEWIKSSLSQVLWYLY